MTAMDCKVYVGDLGYGAAKQELEDVFSKYGPLRNVWVARNPPGFAFVEFEDPRDAEDAVRALDGTSDSQSRLNGRRVRVEMSTGRSRRGGRRPLPSSGPRYGSGSGSGSGNYGRDSSSRYRRRSRSYSPRGRGRSRSYSRSRSRSGSRERRRSASRERREKSNSREGSLDRFGRDKSKKVRESHSKSPARKSSKSRARSTDQNKSGSRDRSKSRSRSRSRSGDEKGMRDRNDREENGASKTNGDHMDIKNKRSSSPASYRPAGSEYSKDINRENSDGD